MADADIKVSVLVPAYNMAEYLDEAIRSVLNGTFDDLEIIVIDDGSTDTTRSIVAEYTDPSGPRFDPRVHYEYQSNSGKSVAVNRGIGLSQGNYITILDADDQLTPFSLLHRYKAIEGEEAGIAVGGFEVFREEKTLGRREAPSCPSPRVLRRQFYLSHKTPFSLNNCLMPKVLVTRTGFFDAELKRCQDIDYALRLLENTQRVAIVNSIVYRYRKYRSSVRERLILRLKTLWYRAKVMWKNFRGPVRVFVVLYAGLLDLGKTLYEIAGIYKR